LSVPGVKSAFVDDDLPRGEGTLDIYLMAESGPPDALLLAQVQEVIDAHRPITADALVLSPEVVTVPVTASLTPRAGWDPEAIDAEARRRLAVYFGELEDASLGLVPLGVGKDVVVSQVVALLMAIPGVYSVDLASPVATVVIAPNQVPALGAVTLTMEAPSNE
jgi:phage-related baseplate assembly protein